MRRILRGVFLAVLAVVVVLPTGSGCGKPEGKPNPDLKVPDVPPGGRGTKDPGMTQPGKKDAGKK
jgi:hypothetical protein